MAPFQLTADDLQEWEENGCLLLTEVLTEADLDSLDAWATEISSWDVPPDLPGFYTVHFERAKGEVVLCRVENYTPFHKPLRELAEERLAPVISQLLAGEPAVLFKEKLNLKHPGGKGYAPHYDGPSAAAAGLATTFITVQVAVDVQTVENGCLEVVRPRSTCPSISMLPPVAGGDPDGAGRVGAMAEAAVAACRWEPIEAPRGSVFLFHGLLPHRSGPNLSLHPRRTLYMLFNPASEGDHHEEYYSAMAQARAEYKAKGGK